MAKTNELLLDTCAAIWLSLQARMLPEAVQAIDKASDQGLPLRLSLITAWELGLLEKERARANDAIAAGHPPIVPPIARRAIGRLDA